MSDPTGNAFPIFDRDGDYYPHQSGLTKREYFAAIAMQGMLASESENYNHGSNSSQKVALLAVEQADALIAALNGDISI